MDNFSPEDFGPVIAGLIDLKHRNSLGPGSPRRESESALAALTVESAFGHTKVADRDMAECCLAGLWLHHDFLDRSHDFSQEISSSSGSFWHGIMHRREQDYSNAKYWFRRVGSHPVFEKLANRMAAEEISSSRIAEQVGLATNDWDPYEFVDACQQSAGRGDEQESFCQQLAWLEWQELFQFCYDRAVD